MLWLASGTLQKLGIHKHKGLRCRQAQKESGTGGSWQAEKSVTTGKSSAAVTLSSPTHTLSGDQCRDFSVNHSGSLCSLLSYLSLPAVAVCTCCSFPCQPKFPSKNTSPALNSFRANFWGFCSPHVLLSQMTVNSLESCIVPSYRRVIYVSPLSGSLPWVTHWEPPHTTVLGKEVTSQRQRSSQTAVLLKPSAWLQWEPGHVDGEEVYGALSNVRSRQLAQVVPKQWTAGGRTSPWGKRGISLPSSCPLPWASTFGYCRKER